MPSMSDPAHGSGAFNFGQFSQRRHSSADIKSKATTAQCSLELGEFSLASEKIQEALTAFDKLKDKTDQEIFLGALLWRQYAQAKVMAWFLSSPEASYDIYSQEFLSYLRPDEALTRLECWTVPDYKLSYFIGLAQGATELLQQGYSESKTLKELCDFFFGDRKKDILLASYNAELKSLSSEIANSVVGDFNTKWTNLMVRINKALDKDVIDLVDKAKIDLAKPDINRQIEKQFAAKLTNNRDQLLQVNLTEIQVWLTAVLANSSDNLSSIFEQIHTHYSTRPELLYAVIGDDSQCEAFYNLPLKALAALWGTAIFSRRSLTREDPKSSDKFIKILESRLGIDSSVADQPYASCLSELRFSLAELKYFTQSQKLQYHVAKLKVGTNDGEKTADTITREYETLDQLFIDLGGLVQNGIGVNSIAPRSLVLSYFDLYRVTQDLVNINLLPPSRLTNKPPLEAMISRFSNHNWEGLVGKLPPHIVQSVKSLKRT